MDLKEGSWEIKRFLSIVTDLVPHTGVLSSVYELLAESHSCTPEILVGNYFLLVSRSA